ncbi:hypothetical protein WBG06_24685 [Nocardioides sp. CCNWLW239]|uniref:hypothetical protein n=1 Tax=Nocardioides sp. CCNWLW239 TaxID=3128902 RepID=UPI00301602DF
MPKKRKKPRKHQTQHDVRFAAERREEHARLVVERQGDPNYVQQTRNPDGSRTVQLDEETAGARRQREHFVEKFGREPTDDDPIFFDPNADEPRPMGEPDWDEILAAFDAAGIDGAMGEAYRELGFIVTEMNQHTFTAHEVELWNETVGKYMRKRG